MIEAVIGACYLYAGYEQTARAVVEAFTPEIEEALGIPWTSSPPCRSCWRDAATEVGYAVTDEQGPPHARTFTVAARWTEKGVKERKGRSKKHAEQEAARVALEQVGGIATPCA